MVMLVSLEQARAHLYVDTTDNDNDITIKIKAASQAVMNYIDDDSFLNSSGEVDVDSSDNPIGVPEPIQAATLLVVGDLFTDRDMEDFRDGKAAPRTGDIILSRTVHWLLDPYRLPLVV